MKNKGDQEAVDFSEITEKANSKILEWRRELVWTRLITGCEVSDEEILTVDWEPTLTRRCAYLQATAPTPEQWERFHSFIDSLTYEQLTAASELRLFDR